MPDTVETAARLGVGHLTLYAFSVENWKRPRAEVWTLMNLLKEYVRRELDTLVENDIRFSPVGRGRELDPSVVEALERAERATAGCSGLRFNIALNYSGRCEIVDAYRKVVADWAAGRRVDIDEAALSESLYTAGQPDPDLLIRTSGELRVSNFLLWQITYSEIWVTPTLWPDFRCRHLLDAIIDFQRRSSILACCDRAVIPHPGRTTTIILKQGEATMARPAWLSVAVLALLSLPVAPVFAADPQIERFAPTGSVKAVRQVTARFTVPMVPFGDPRLVVPFEIDCPEKGQAYGNKAKQATSALVFGKQVTLQTHGKVKYKRTIADVILPDGTSVNHELVKEGWCWWYRKYAPGDTVLKGLENEAREAKKGLWADPQPVPPWEWRRGDRYSDCHTKTAAAPMKTKLQAAFHDLMAKKGTCVDCHAKDATKKAPAKCPDCHKKENV